MASGHSDYEDEAISDEEAQLSWRCNSTPKRQFDDLILQEMDRIWESDPRTEGRPDKHLHVNSGIQGGWLHDAAFEEVKAQWVEQGIWKDEWEHNESGPGSMDLWKHEEPLQCVFLDPPSQTGHEARCRPKWKAEIVRQHEASRPINQFIYQVTNECERLASQNKEDASAAPGDINTQAYEIVRSRWFDRHIWDEEWGVLPGMAWQHEKPPPAASDTESEPETDSSELSPLPAILKQRRQHEPRERTKSGKAGIKELWEPRRSSKLYSRMKSGSKGRIAKVRFADPPIETY
ncbi:hypothetical protein F5Y05DRAFT_412346 [Hypoxylon sp. FL0543]|nr:hypothetical protein F5Y05DRAFT_412346 [Hypoxylon sp. FL0543]